MTISVAEIETRWLGDDAVDIGVEALVDSFNRAELLLGRDWLEQPLSSGATGSAVALPLHVVGERLRTIEQAHRRQKLIARVRNRDEAALSELHAIALCAAADGIEIEIEPEIIVDRRNRIPDFRLRRRNETWVHVEVTAPTLSESGQAAANAATWLASSVESIPDGVTVQVRFRDEPTHKDLAEVLEQVPGTCVGQTVDRPRFVMFVAQASPSFTPAGSDERGRPIMGAIRGRLHGDQRAGLLVRVPFTDERGQRILDSEAKQLPKEGPGLVCILTNYTNYWSGLIERSFSSTVRRRISGVLLFHSGIVPGDRGARLPTIGRLFRNPHARVPLPSWLIGTLEGLRREF